MTKMKWFAVCACMLGAFACGSSDGNADTSTEQDATTCVADDVAPAPPSNAAARKVSFSSDVLPVFIASCSFSSCHGATRGDNHGVFLGRKGANDASAIRAGLVDRPSKQSPSTPLVAPSDLSRSYLVRKLEGTMCDLADCSGGTCGQAMPRGGNKLDAATLDVVRTWIVQGAPDS